MIVGTAVLWTAKAGSVGVLAAGLVPAMIAGWVLAQAVPLPRAAPSGGVTKVVAHTGLVLSGALFAVLAVRSLSLFAGTKEKAYVSAMRSDLRNLATVQETYWNNNQTYYGGAIPDLPNFQYSPSKGIAVTVVNADAAGWSATATAPARRRVIGSWSSTGACGACCPMTSMCFST